MYKKTLVFIIVIALLISIMSAFGVSATSPEDIMQGISQVKQIYPDDMGICFSDRYPDGGTNNFARGIYDMKTFDNKVFLGCGDTDKNAGPIPAYYYDGNSCERKSCGVYDSEAIETFVVTDGQLFAPATDPKEYGDGLFYRFDTQKDIFVLIDGIKNMIHMYDIVYFDGYWFVFGASGEIDGSTYILRSKTLDGSFEDVSFDAAAGTVTTRFYEAFIYNGELYTYMSYDNPHTKLFKYNTVDDTFYYDSSLSLAQVVKDDENIPQKQQYLDSMVFIMNGMFVTKDLKSYTEIKLKDGYIAHDMLELNGRLYVLASVKDKYGIYQNSVFRTDNLTDYTEIYSFETAAYANCLEYCNGRLWFATATTRDEQNPDAGRVYNYYIDEQNKPETPAATYGRQLVYEAEFCPRTSNTDCSLSYSNVEPFYGKFFSNVAMNYPEEGRYVEYTLSDIPAGRYNLVINSRDMSGRSVWQVSADGANIGAPIDFNSKTSYETHSVGQVSVNSLSDVKLRFTIITARTSGMSVDNIVLERTDGADIVITRPTTATRTTYRTTRAVKTTKPLTSGSRISFEAEDCEYECAANCPKLEMGDSVIRCFEASSAVVGDYIEFSLPGIPAGEYMLMTITRSDSQKSSLQLSVNGEKVGEPVNMATPAFDSSHKNEFGICKLMSDGDIKVRFTITVANGSGGYFDKIYLVKTADIAAALTTGDSQRVPGDANSDRSFNAKDMLLLRQYLSNWSVTIDLAAADVNADSYVNAKDLLRIRQKLAGWDVKFGVA